MRFETEISTAKPMSRHSKDKPFSCPHCPATFRLARHRKAHLRLHSGERFLCEHCPMAFKRRHELKVHVRHHNGEKTHCCHLCPAKFIRSEDLEAHRTTHSSENFFGCAHCAARFRSKKVLTNHVTKHCSEQILSCPDCPATFSQAFMLKIHLRKHRGEKLHTYTPTDADSSVYAQDVDSQTPSVDERKFVCSECPAKFKCASELREHLDVHLAEEMESDNGDDLLEFPVDFNLWEHMDVISVDRTDTQNHLVVRNDACAEFATEFNHSPGLREHSVVDLTEEMPPRSPASADSDDGDHTSPESPTASNCSSDSRTRTEDLPTQMPTDATIAQETDAQVDSLEEMNFACLECSAKFKYSSDYFSHLDVHLGKDDSQEHLIEESNVASNVCAESSSKSNLSSDFKSVEESSQKYSTSESAESSTKSYLSSDLKSVEESSKYSTLEPDDRYYASSAPSFKSNSSVDFREHADVNLLEELHMQSHLNAEMQNAEKSDAGSEPSLSNCSFDLREHLDTRSVEEMHSRNNLGADSDEGNYSSSDSSASSDYSYDLQVQSNTLTVEKTRLKNVLSSNSSEKRHPCPDCPARFNCHADLEKHLEVHLYLKKINLTF